MSRSIFQKTIAATLGAAIVSTGLFVGISSYAQGGTTTTPSPTSSPSSPAPSGGGSMTQPATTPGGTSSPTTTPAAAPAASGKTIVTIAAGNKNFTTLVKALKAADLVETLSGEGPFTVFAPTNAAFAKLPKATLANLLKPANKAQLVKILTYHVVPGAVTSKMLKSGAVATVEGGSVNVKVKGKNVTVNKAKVILADVKASNGVIHAIDTVLTPTK